MTESQPRQTAAPLPKASIPLEAVICSGHCVWQQSPKEAIQSQSGAVSAHFETCMYRAFQSVPAFELGRQSVGFSRKSRSGTFRNIAKDGSIESMANQLLGA
jgi:hypothetical protein